MEKVQGVSLPRCGHNLLVGHLQAYFQVFDSCPASRKKLLAFVAQSRVRQKPELLDDDRFHYCEYYYSCRSNPCCDRGNTFQKSHDFELDLPIDVDQKYIVQSRNELGLLISWFELRIPRKREVDSESGFIAFVQRMQPYLKGFRKKWIESELSKRLLLDYDDYLARPAEMLRDTLLFFRPDQKVNMQKVRAIVSDVLPARRVCDFRFYEAAIATGYFANTNKRLAS